MDRVELWLRTLSPPESVAVAIAALGAGVLLGLGLSWVTFRWARKKDDSPH